MPNVRRLDDVLALVHDHDAFLVDLWGVVHDGERLGEGVRDVVDALAATGARVLFLSNSSRLGPLLEDGLVAMGLRRESFVGVVSSGDVTREALVRRTPEVFARCPPAPRVLHVGSAGYVPWLFEMGLDFCTEPTDADLVVATGTVPSAEALAELQAQLAPLAARGTPLVCTNPDRVIPSARGLTLAPGAIAHAYASIGGPTFLYGKPHAPIYEAALRRLGAPRERIVAIGDMIETDIAGARAASITSVLVTTGVHASELGSSPDDARLADVFDAHGATPDAVLAWFGRKVSVERR